MDKKVKVLKKCDQCQGECAKSKLFYQGQVFCSGECKCAWQESKDVGRVPGITTSRSLTQQSKKEK